MSINVTIDGLDNEIDVTMTDSSATLDPATYVGLRGFTGLHVSTEAPTSADGLDGDIWVIVNEP